MHSKTPYPSRSADSSPIAQSVSATLKKRGRFMANIWIFCSPKNDKVFHIKGDVAFMHCVLLEGNLEIASYRAEPENPVFFELNGETHKTLLDAIATTTAGEEIWMEFKREKDVGPKREGRSVVQLAGQASAALAADKRYQIKTERDLKGKEIRFDNLLMLCAWVNRCRLFAQYHEATILERLFSTQRQATLKNVLDQPGADVARMQAVVAKAILNGVLTTNLDHTLFGATSFLKREAL